MESIKISLQEWQEIFRVHVELYQQDSQPMIANQELNLVT